MSIDISKFKAKYLLIILGAVFFHLCSCSKKTVSDKCAGQGSNPEPLFVGLRFVDKTSGKDLIADKTIDTSDIRIYEEDSTLIQYKISINNDTIGILAFTPPEIPRAVTLTVHLNDTTNVKFSYTGTSQQTDCSVNFSYGDFSITNYPFSYLSGGSSGLEVKI